MIPVTISTTDREGRTVTVTSSALDRATASVTADVTTTDTKGKTVTVRTTAPAIVHTVTNAQGATVTTTSRAQVYKAPTFTSGQVVSTTNDEGSTLVTTFTPDGGSVSSLVLQTTTLDDGSLQTLTSYATVAAASATDADATTEAPSLQTGNSAAHLGSKMAAAAAAGLAGAAFML